MFYSREIPMLAKHVEEQQSVLGGVEQMLWNKMMFQPANELWNNRDFYGYNIYNEDSPYYQRAWQIGKYILGDQFNPIGFSSGVRALRNAGKWNDADPWYTKLEKLATEPESQGAIAGFGPAPTYASRSAAVNRLSYLYRRYVSPSEQEEAGRARMQEMLDARNAYMRAQREGDPATVAKEAKHLQELGMTAKGIRGIRQGQQDLHMLTRLSGVAPDRTKNFMLSLDKADFQRYYPALSKKQRADPDLRQRFQQYSRGYAHGGVVDDKLLKSHRTVRYQPTPNGSQQCSHCTMFRKPNGCTAVAGYISPRGWCKLFDRDARRI